MVDDLLQHTAQVSNLCKALLQTAPAITDRQTDALQKIAANADRFSSIVIEMRELLESRDYRVRGYGHELRVPLTAIRGFTQLMYEGVFGPLTDFQRLQISQLDQRGKDLHVLLETIMNNAAPWPNI